MKNYRNNTRFYRILKQCRWLLMARLFVALFVPMGLTNCGGESAAPAASDTSYVPFFTFGFQGVIILNAAGDWQTVSFNSSQTPSVSTGTMSFSLSVSNINATTQLTNAQGTGTFAGRSLNINLTDPVVLPLSKAYTGHFIEDDTFVLTSSTASAPSLTLVRADQSFRPRLDASTWKGLNAQGNTWTVSLHANPPSDPNPFAEPATVLLTGTDTLGGTLSGYAVMRRIELKVTRAGNSTFLSGLMQPVGQTPPKTSIDTKASAIIFSDGSSLTRLP